MASLLDRGVGLLLGLDEGANALFGGSARETISGTVGRACAARAWWGPAARFLIEVQPWFGAGHCASQAAAEAARRQALAAVVPLQPPIAAVPAETAAVPPSPTPSTPPDPGPQTELPMSLNVKALASRVAAVGVAADNAVVIVNEVVSLIGLAENLYAGIKGAAKFAAVMKGLDAVVDRLGLSDKLDAIRNAVAPIINLVVSVLNSGSLWDAVFSSIATFAKSVSKTLSPAASEGGTDTGAAGSGA